LRCGSIQILNTKKRVKQRGKGSFSNSTERGGPMRGECCYLTYLDDQKIEAGDRRRREELYYRGGPKSGGVWEQEVLGKQAGKESWACGRLFMPTKEKRRMVASPA